MLLRRHDSCDLSLTLSHRHLRTGLQADSDMHIIGVDMVCICQCSSVIPSWPDIHGRLQAVSHGQAGMHGPLVTGAIRV